VGRLLVGTKCKCRRLGWVRVSASPSIKFIIPDYYDPYYCHDYIVVSQRIFDRTTDPRNCPPELQDLFYGIDNWLSG